MGHKQLDVVEYKQQDDGIDLFEFFSFTGVALARWNNRYRCITLTNYCTAYLKAI